MEELPVIALGCLLHDIGKVIQRADENPKAKSHSRFGYEFLEKPGLVAMNKYWQWVLECVRFHHWKDIKERQASLPIAWFAFEADNLASAHDRRTAPSLFDNEDNRLEETDQSCSDKWEPFRRLDSIFTHFKNIDEVNREYPNKLPLWFRRTKDGHFTRDSYPYPESKDVQADALQSYQILRDRVLSPLVEFLKSQDPTSRETVNAVLHYLEENLSMTPPDTFRDHTNDVSLYDHLKLTAAIGTCMYAYVAEKHPNWLEKLGRQIPWDRAFRSQPAYLLVKADMSGIQEFIYNVSSKAALKGLRGRSFYLELLQSHLSDYVLSELNLSRANLLYQGGGGFVMLLPNTQIAHNKLKKMRSAFNEWLFDAHKGRLFMALEWTEVTGEQLRAGSGGTHSMANAWSEISKKIGKAKGEKFKENLAKVFEISPHIEECLICHRDDLKLVKWQGGERDVCPLCRDLIEIGSELPNADCSERGGKDAELHIQANAQDFGLLPNLTGDSNQLLGVSIEKKERAGKDSFVLHNFDLFRPPKLFWSLYKYRDNEFQQLAQAAAGVKRIAVLRADVDNLGKIFSGTDKRIGLPQELRSISRDAAVSRSLARFFSHYLDDLLHDKGPKGTESWAITTVYAGGDDVFLVGAWDQVIEFALLLQSKFEQFTCGHLTMSAGIAIQKPKYPFYRLAQEAQEAEHAAKMSPRKNSLCVRFDERISEGIGLHNFSWYEWSSVIKSLVDSIEILADECGVSRSFWNDLLVFSRRSDLSFYRLLYNVARTEESNARLQQSSEWLAFKRDWIVPLRNADFKDKKNQLETALNWFLLLTRDGRQLHDERDSRKVAAGVR